MERDSLTDRLLDPEKLTHEDCLDGPEGCRGAVEYRMALSPTGRAFPRCDFHWSKRLDKEDASFSYRSDVPPSWFDPAYAGERWDEEY